MQESRDKGESSDLPGTQKSGRGNQSDVDLMQRKLSSPMEKTETRRGTTEKASTNVAPSDKEQTAPELSKEKPSAMTAEKKTDSETSEEKQSAATDEEPTAPKTSEGEPLAETDGVHDDPALSEEGAMMSSTYCPGLISILSIPRAIAHRLLSLIYNPVSDPDDATGGNGKDSGDAEDEPDIDSFETLELHEEDMSRPSTEEKLCGIQRVLSGTSWIRSPFQEKHRVVIFSRSPESEYRWLKTRLESGPFQDVVDNVRSHEITNTGFLQFYEVLFRCTFGILYHSKNRGRINVTDVTDSLYDEELQYMSKTLGKTNVIVIIDDLSDNSDQVKKQILRNQPSIEDQAQDLFLFTSEDHEM